MARPRLNLRRYHKNVHFPDNTAIMCLEFFGQISEVDVTYHAAEQLMEDKRTIIPLPSREELIHSTNTLVEFYEVLDASGEPQGKIQKMLIRVHNLHEQYDFAYVLAREGYIVSAWANDKGDDHRLDSRAAREYWKPKLVEEAA